MKTNLLAQNDNLVIENLKADVGKSVMDLSHSVTFPIDVDGAILPICCIETLPSDSFEISCEVLLRQLSPLKVPLMTNLRLNTAFFYCDNRMAWKKWDRFMTGGRSGNEVYDIPRLANFAKTNDSNISKFDLLDVSGNFELFRNVKLSNSLHTYFGISMNHKLNSEPTFDSMVDYSDDLPISFSEFDYQMICRDFYTDIDRLSQNPDTSNFFDFDKPFADWAYSNLFPSDDDEIRLRDGPSIMSGFHSDDDSSGVNILGFVLDKVRYHNVRPDYFSSSKKAPMRGDAPSISNVSSSFKLPSGTTISLVNSNGVVTDINGDTKVMTTGILGGTVSYSFMQPYASLQDYDSSSHPERYLVVNDPDYVAGNGSPDTPKKLMADSKNLTKVSGATDSDITMSGTLLTNITAADIRLLSQLTVWQELNMLHEPYYNDFLNAHFDNVRVGESPVEKPQYIGGTSQIISINEILQTSQSTESSPLGNQGATAMSLAHNNVGKYYCNNYGYIIGVAYIVPDLMYKPAMPRGFSRRTKEDYYSPEFANLSMQATLNKEIFFSNNDTWNNSPWGYTGAFDELRSIPNRIAGDLLNDSYTDLQKWVLTREFANDNLPSMSTNWLSLKDNVDKSAWSVTTMPAFMLQCANYIKAVRPMPKVAIPKAL